MRYAPYRDHLSFNKQPICKMSENNWKFGTIANHAGQEPENWENLDVVLPISLSTTYKYLDASRFKKYEYGRHENPTRDSLETCLAKLENAQFSLCFPSGLGALTAVLSTFKNGDHFVVSNDLYGGTLKPFKHFDSHMNIKVTFVDFTDVKNIEKAIQPNTKMIYLETPTNPKCIVMDIKKISEVAKRNDIIVVVDNTFLTAYYQKPMEHGADITLYSLTKYYNGHGDVIMGALVTKKKEIYDQLKHVQKCLGFVPSPFDCYLVLRGLKTLHLRLTQQYKSALAIANFLEKHPKIENLRYAGLPSHPQHEIIKKQTTGSSGMLSFAIKGDRTDLDHFLKSIKVFILAVSLGGTESLVCVPFYMTHPQYTVEERLKQGITQNSIRMSVGLEDTDDLIEDLKQALNKS